MASFASLIDQTSLHSSRLIRVFPSLGALGVCVYLLSSMFPIHWQLDIPLFLLCIVSMLAILSESRASSGAKLPFGLSTAIFCVVLLMAIAFSVDINRSLRLSTSLLPAILVFLIIAGYFKGTKDLIPLFYTLSISALGLSAALLLIVLVSDVTNPFEWISRLGSPFFVVKNDVTFLSVVFPLSLSLFCLSRWGFQRMLVLTSLISSVVVIAISQSRVAVLTLIVSLACFCALARTRFALFITVAVPMSILLIDGVTGFHLLERFVRHWDGTGRIPLWCVGWKMFLEAPLLGQGPHTFILFYSQYLDSFNFPSWLFVDRREIPWPHNLYVEMLAEVGLLGMITCSVLLGKGLWLAMKSSLSQPFDKSTTLGRGTFAGLLGFSVAAAIELTFLREWVVVIMFTLLGITGQITSLRKYGQLGGSDD